MEILASFVGSAVVSTGRFFCGYIYPRIKNIVRFQSNLNALEKQMRDLKDLRNNVIQELELAEIDGKLPTTQVKEWLRGVERIELQVNSLQAGNTSNNEKLCGYFLTCTLRYTLSRQVEKMLKEVQSLLKAASFPVDTVAVNYLATVKHIPGPSVEDQTTTSKTLAKTMNLLSDDGVRRIGIWGMGGVGKTTLVKNLNNKLKITSLAQPLGMVIWATVSKELDLKRVQTQIAERLGLPATMEESQQGLAIRLYERLMKERKFLLILDDVWETIDLDSLGIPQPEIHMGSKIILTSRSLEVCRGMKIDAEVKVEVLNDEEAWHLFITNAGKEASLEHIKPFAEVVAKECNGLPLAIIVVGTAMRGKAMIEVWKDALNMLQRSEPYIGGIENKVYKPLRWSYDSLQGKNIKPCFLYCSLFPEDCSIEVSELVQCWMAEGLMYEQQNYEDSLNRGITIVENLKDSCLLEEGIRENTVKMHDVVRDVAIWIASSMEDGCKSLVRSGKGLSQISDVEMLNLSKRISFMDNKITTLPDSVIQCPKTSTLLLQGNYLLESVPNQFLQGFQVLKVLNMSRTCIQSLPLSLTQLGELRALLLQHCSHLTEIPPLGGLQNLQVLDLSHTQIRELPKGIDELSNLRLLNLSYTPYLITIQAGVVSRLCGLEVLDMTLSAYKWGMKGDVEEGQATVEELGCLKRLIVVYIWLGSLPYTSSEDLVWLERLRSFQIIVGPFVDVDFIVTKCDERKVILSGLDLSEKQIRWLLINANNLVLDSCKDVGWMFEYIVINSIDFPGLKSLTIARCHSLGPFRGCAAQHNLLPNLEKLYLYSSKQLKCAWPLVAPLGLRFSKLRLIQVSECPKLRYLIPHGLIQYLINLEEIKVGSCENLKMLFQYSSMQTMPPDSVVPKLRILELKNLPKLRSICREKESWQSLEQLEVINCNLLRRLPLTVQNTNTIKEVRGEHRWWSELEWDDDDTKLSLLPYFKPVGAQTTIIEPEGDGFPVA